MTLVEAIVLGLVQGLTEFLPISSTAHLRIVPELLGWGDPGAAFSAVIQLGTVVAVVIYFWRDLIRLSVAWVKSVRDKKPFATAESRLAWFVGLGTIPICVFGLLLKKPIETHFRSLYVISTSLVVLAILLLVAERVGRKQRTIEEMSLRDGIAIGLWQCVALIPGSSRSGTTITGGLFQGLTRADAARYSFLLSIPATSLAGVFELKHLVEDPARPPLMLLVVGNVVAFASGLACIAGLIAFLKSKSTMVFVVYRILLAVTLVGLLTSGKLQPMSGVAAEKVAQQTP